MKPQWTNSKQRLLKQLPDLSPALPTALVSINHEFAFPTEAVPDGAEVALFPPVSGGSNLHSQISEAATILRVTDAELDLNELVTSITVPETGAGLPFHRHGAGQDHPFRRRL